MTYRSDEDIDRMAARAAAAANADRFWTTTADLDVEGFGRRVRATAPLAIVRPGRERGVVVTSPAFHVKVAAWKARREGAK